MSISALLLVTAVLVSIFVQLWLFGREIRYQRARRDHVPQRLAKQFTGQTYRAAVDYTIAKVRLSAISAVLDAVTALLWTLAGAVAFVTGAWNAGVQSGTAAEIGVVVTVVVIQAALHGLLAIYRQFVIERHIGLGRMSKRLFLQDTLIKGCLLIAATIFVAAICVPLVRELGTAGWFLAWLVWTAFNVAGSWLYPTIVAPLFNRFTELDDPDLAERIERLMERSGRRIDKVLVMDGSRRSAHGNAYDAGAGSARRVVLLDTLLQALETEETLAVVAHELGHVKHAHIAKRQMLLATIGLIWIAGFGPLLADPDTLIGLNVPAASEGAVLALLWILAPVLGFVVKPLNSYVSRVFEFQADHFVVEHDDAKALRAALLKLYHRNAAVADSEKLFSFVHSSHPTLPNRLARLEPVQPSQSQQPHSSEV